MGMNVVFGNNNLKLNILESLTDTIPRKKFLPNYIRCIYLKSVTFQFAKE